MPEFAHIKDDRQRVLARLNLALRSGSADDPLAQDALRAGVQLTDFDRRVVAGHLLAAIEDELGHRIADGDDTL